MACHHLLWILLGVITEPFWGFTVLGAVISVCVIFYWETEPFWGFTVLGAVISVCVIFYWETCGSPVIKCFCFFVVFFFPPPQNGKKLRNSTQWSLGHQHHDN